MFVGALIADAVSIIACSRCVATIVLKGRPLDACSGNCGGQQQSSWIRLLSVKYMRTRSLSRACVQPSVGLNSIPQSCSHCNLLTSRGQQLQRAACRGPMQGAMTAGDQHMICRRVGATDRCSTLVVFAHASDSPGPLRRSLRNPVFSLEDISQIS